MEQMLYNILLALSLLLNAYYILKLEHDAKIDRRRVDRAVTSQNQQISNLALNLARIDERLKAVEETLKDLPVEEITEENKRLKAFNDGVASIMAFGPDVPKLNKEGLTNG